MWRLVADRGLLGRDLGPQALGSREALRFGIRGMSALLNGTRGRDRDLLPRLSPARVGRKTGGGMGTAREWG